MFVIFILYLISYLIVQ